MLYTLKQETKIISDLLVQVFTHFKVETELQTLLIESFLEILSYLGEPLIPSTPFSQQPSDF